MKKPWSRLAAGVLSLGMVWTGLPTAVSAEEALAIRAGHVFTGTGEVHRDAVVLIRDGRIAAVGPGLTVPGDVRTVERDVVAPGWVDLGTRLGAWSGVVEATRSLLLEARAATGIDYAHRDYRHALRAGVTTAVVVPGDRAVVSGRAAVVKTGSAGGDARLVEGDGALVLNFTQAALSWREGPTAPVGAVQILRDALAHAGGDGGHAGLRSLLGGGDAAFVRWQLASELRAALELARAHEMKLVLYGGGELLPSMSALSGAGFPVVVGPLSSEASPGELGVPGRLQAAGVSVAFASSAPARSPETLRLTAAMAVQYGMDSAAALAALTSVPAEILGLSDRIGSIAPGKDADLAVWTDDPLNLSARLVETYVGGERVFRAGDRKGKKGASSGH